MSITAAELVDQRGGTTPRGGRKIIASGIRARRVTPLRMSEPDVDEAPRPTTVQPEGEATMPKGIYPRKLKSEAAAPGEGAGEPKPRKRRKVAKMKRPHLAKAPAIASQRFGVFEDGSIQISTKACKGNLAPDEVDALRNFLARLEGKKK